MVGDARFVNVKLLTRKLGGTEINIVLNTFVRFASPKYGLEHNQTLRLPLKRRAKHERRC